MILANAYLTLGEFDQRMQRMPRERPPDAVSPFGDGTLDQLHKRDTRNVKVCRKLGHGHL
jgi:hypothetical protein